MHSILFENPEIGGIDVCLVKSLTALLRLVVLGQSYPICIHSLYLGSVVSFLLAISVWPEISQPWLL